MIFLRARKQLYSCSILADSLNTATNDRLTTMLMTFPNIVHQEMVRHRAFSFSVGSNRAIPVQRLIQKVHDDPFVPERFPEKGKGMTPKGYYEHGSEEESQAHDVWMATMHFALEQADKLDNIGIHKGIANRLLGPFQWVTMVVTGDQRAWRNFFLLRSHPDAQFEMQRISDLALALYMENTVDKKIPGEWHVPFGDIYESVDFDPLKLSVARCARTSYLTHDREVDLADDTRLHDQLLTHTPPHAGPFEHQAKALVTSYRFANLQGWRSYRNQLEAVGKMVGHSHPNEEELDEMLSGLAKIR